MANKINWEALYAQMPENERAQLQGAIGRINAWEAGLAAHREDTRVYYQLLNKYLPQTRGSWVPFALALVLFFLNLFVPLVKMPAVPIGTKLAVLVGSAAFALIFTLGLKLKWRLTVVQFVSFQSTFMVLFGGTIMLLGQFRAHPAIVVPVLITMFVPLFESLIPIWIKQFRSSEPFDLWLNITSLVANVGVEVLEGVVLAFIMTLYITPINYGWLCALVCCVRVLWRTFGAKGTGLITGGTLRILGATSAGLFGVWLAYLFLK